MTRISIQGTEYDLTAAVSAAGLGDLFTLKVKTKALGYPVTLRSINQLFVELAERAKDPDFDPMELLDDEATLLTFTAVLWLSKRKAGETLTFEDAGLISFTEFSLLADEDEEQADPDPKALPGSDPVDAP